MPISLLFPVDPARLIEGVDGADSGDHSSAIDEAAQGRNRESALRSSEETASVSLDALEQGVLLADQSGAIHRMNPAAERILGYTTDELTSFWSSGQWETYDEAGTLLALADRPIMRAVTSGRAVSGVIVGWRHKDGHRILVRLSCIPNADGAGGLVIAFTDITEEDLARRLLDATLETAPVGLAILDADRAILRCNATFAEQAGRSPEELIGTDVVSLLHSGDRPEAAAVGREMRFGTQTGGQLDQRVVRPDGTEIWVNTHLAVIPNSDQPLAVAATFDVTERRHMLRELSRFSFLFSHANDIITVIDAAGQVLYASPSSERILGYPDGYRHPDGIFGLIHPDDFDLASAEFAALVAGTRTTDPFTVRVKAYADDWRYIECVGVNLLDEPAVGGIVITSRDATERVLLGEQLAHAALHDTLTDLPNRRLLETTLRKALARSEREQRHIGVCFIDLDDFKVVNDTLGHVAGDQLLIAIADRLRRTIRTGDTAARVGGDEFVIVLDPISDPEQALAVATRIHAGVKSASRRALQRTTQGASIGVAISCFGDTTSSLLNRADTAMYQAKAQYNTSIKLAV